MYDSVSLACIHRNTRTNCPTADGTTIIDENMMVKAMQRTSEKNLDGNLGNKSLVECVVQIQPIMMSSPMLPGMLSASPSSS